MTEPSGGLPPISGQPQASGAQPEPDKPDPDLTYPGAPESLISHWMHRRRRMALGPNDALPPLDADLKALLATVVQAPDPAPVRPGSMHAAKLHGYRVELAGKSELSVLNAILISHLRKARFPRHAPALFRRLWIEEGDALRAELPGRWLISSIITFGDHGETEEQRRIGLSMNVFLSLIKLYEFERFHSGLPGDSAFPVRRTRGRVLPLGMQRFALVGGGLDVNLLAQLWNEARNEPVAGALACHLLDMLNKDRNNLFRRIRAMRTEKHAERAKGATASDVPPVDEDPSS
jgi:hypothetical protein